jgi:hypothetical protein
MAHPSKGAKAQPTEQQRASLRVDIEKSLDRALEMKSAELDIPKRELVEQAIRMFLEGQVAA